MIRLMNKPAHQIEEARRLSAIYSQRKAEWAAAGKKLSQAVVAERCGWDTQSVVSQYMTGRIPLNVDALIRFGELLNFPPEDVSPRLAELMRRGKALAAETSAEAQPLPGGALAGASRGKEESSTITLTPMDVWSDETPLGEDEVEIPFFKEVELAAGKGSDVMLETGGRKLRFGKRTLQRKGIPPEAAAGAIVTGNSMEPVLPDGSTVGVDTSRTQVTDGQMYAISHEGQLRVKVLYRQPGNGLRLRSYNSDEHPDERYDGAYVAEHIRIIGKVFWYSVLI